MSFDTFADVREFHAKFGLHHRSTDSRPTPQAWNQELMEFRLKFLKEEVEEFEDAMNAHDHPGMFDALIDLVYVALGTAHLQDYPWYTGWNLVQRANMAKVRAQADGSDSKRGSSFDVVKPEGWKPPDIARLLSGFGWFEYTCSYCHAELRKLTADESFRIVGYTYDNGTTRKFCNIPHLEAFNEEQKPTDTASQGPSDIH